MATQPNTPDCNAPMDAALRMLALAQEWRRDLHALDGRRIQRDGIALRGLQRSLCRTEVGTAVAGMSQVLEDYIASSVSIVQDSIGTTMRHQEEYVNALGGAWNDWRLGWLNYWDRLPGASAGDAMHEWKRLFERSFADMGMTEVLHDGHEALPHGNTMSAPRAVTTKEVQYEG
jgi:hypothetical protein